LEINDRIVSYFLWPGFQGEKFLIWQAVIKPEINNALICRPEWTDTDQERGWEIFYTNHSVITNQPASEPFPNNIQVINKIHNNLLFCCTKYETYEMKTNMEIKKLICKPTDVRTNEQISEQINERTNQLTTVSNQRTN
jgi:hypothetical protein